ncbi:MAG TPA: RecX family transcriptional regulator [Dictyobacter sp.]|nr:RecX family transcriptional regulator [Dictyobacter sp.]
MRITALQSQTTDPDRISVFVDDHFFMGVNAFIVLKMKLRIGQELTSELQAQLQQEEALQKAVDRAMNYLSFRPRSRDEVRRYLRKKETPPELIDVALEKLDHLNLVDDRAFTSFWVESRARFRPKGAQALRHELRMKGVKREVVDEMISDEHDEEQALQAGRQKAQVLMRQAGIDFMTFRARLGPFLQRRGFGYDVAKRTVQTLWDELGGDSTDEDNEE